MSEPTAPLRLAYLTAGAAGMYCGSCLHDNTLARAMTQLGVDVQLIPTYTPIRTDEEDVSLDRVFFGGINVYLEEKSRVFRALAPLFGRFLDHPRLIKWATARQSSIDARSLGGMTVSMLKGAAGHQQHEVKRLCDWLANTSHPDLVNFSNMLIAGCVPELKQQLDAPVLVTLQGDDIFLDSLEEPYRSQALEEIQRLVPHVDGFLVHSRYYADFMSDFLGIPREKIHVVPLGIDTHDFTVAPRSEQQQPTTIGYLARLAPEKGLHNLVDAFLEINRREPDSSTRLLIAGWLGKSNQSYAQAQFRKMDEAGLQHAYEYVGTVDRTEKVEFLQRLDLFTVPTTYHEPKGLFVLEALAAGVPVVQPAHGAFPELLETLGGGKLVAPEDPMKLADGLLELAGDLQLRGSLAAEGRDRVHRERNATRMAEETLKCIRQFVSVGPA